MLTQYAEVKTKDGKVVTIDGAVSVCLKHREEWVFGHAVFDDNPNHRHLVERNAVTGEIRRKT